MSGRLISRNEDLRRLAEEGYELEVRDGCLFVHHVPYVTSAAEVAYGALVCPLSLAGDETVKPEHTMWFIGEAPCDREGHRLERIINASGEHAVAPGVNANHYLSSKPPEGYTDYFEKVTAYIAMITGPAHALDNKATARTFGPIRDCDQDSVFEYMDTATSRYGIAAANVKLKVEKVAIVGLGGTGSHIFDLLAKTPVGEIHLYDGDVLLSHNAFRSPGAPSLEALQERPMKVDHYAGIYSRMRRGIVPHPVKIDASTVGDLRDMDFIFICIDDGPSRRLMVNALLSWEKSFIDVGMGATEHNGSIGASIRVTTSTPTARDHLESRLSFGSGPEDDYRLNIQIADLNALNGTLAVIRWKKIVGYYDDLEHEHHSVYDVDGNTLINSDFYG
jgi:molybdopterin/thiamine biosynthesis adenylyltransferase